MDKIVCSKPFETFSWIYSSGNNKFIALASKTNEANYIGFGTYICYSGNEKEVFQVNVGEDFKPHYSVLESQPKDQIKIDWSLLHKVQIKDIEKLIKSNSQKDLLKLVNSLNISDRHICCDVNYVINSFRNYVQTRGNGK